MRTIACSAGLVVVVVSATSAQGAERTIHREVTVDAALDQVWNAWTTVEGLKSFFAVDATVELRVGGKYELYFDMSAEEGLRGSEGCTILEIDPKKRLAFTWNAPPSIPLLRNANARTRVDLRMQSREPGRTHVALTQTGIQEGPEWDKYYAYFDRAWTNVMKSLDDNSAKLASVSITPAAASIDDFAVLAGRWTGTSSYGRMALQWSKPTGGMMTGMSRLMNDAGTVVMLKFDSIQETTDGIEFRTRHFSPTLIAQEEKDAPLVERLVARNGKEFVFEPVEPGVLKRHWLTLESNDLFVVRAEFERGGETSSFDIAFTRVK